MEPEQLRVELERIRADVRQNARELRGLRKLVADQYKRCMDVERIVEDMEKADEITLEVAKRLKSAQTVRLTRMQLLFFIVGVLCAVGTLALAIHGATR